MKNVRYERHSIWKTWNRMWEQSAQKEEKAAAAVLKESMKRRVMVICAAALALASAGVALFAHMGGKAILSGEAPLTPAPERDLMRVSATLSQGLDRLSGEFHLTVTNRTGEPLEEAVLRVFANAVSEGSLSLTDVRVDGGTASWAFDRDDASVLRVKTSWAPEQMVEISAQFVWKIPRDGGYMGEQDGVVMAVGALPALAMWEDGDWRVDAWDALAEPSYAQAFDMQLSLTAPKGVRIAPGGTPVADEQHEDGTHTVTAQMRGARDVTFAACTGGALHSRLCGDVLVTALAQGGADANRLLDAAQDALGALSDIGLSYPFAALSVVRADTQREDGLIGSGLIALSPGVAGDALTAQATRLAARQTFGVLVENDPWNAPWLSHTLASAAELITYRHTKGQSAYETRFYEQIEVATRLTRPHGVTVGAGVAQFGGDAEMAQVLRDQGAAMLLGIEQAVGEEAFLRALALYVQACAGGVADLDALERAFYQATGSCWDGYLFDGLAA